MTSPKHTPTPWKFNPNRYSKWVGEISGNTPDADYVVSVVQQDNWKANAELIVRAVNSHEALLEAAKIAEKLLREGTSRLSSHAFEGLRNSVVGELQEAISLAERSTSAEEGNP
jgi:hypothetical protein